MRERLSCDSENVVTNDKLALLLLTEQPTKQRAKRNSTYSRRVGAGAVGMQSLVNEAGSAGYGT